MVILDKSGGFRPFEIVMGNEGMGTVYAEVTVETYPLTLVKVVPGIGGYCVAPLSSPTNDYLIGVLANLSVPGEVVPVTVGGILKGVRIRDDFSEASFLRIVDGGIEARSDGPRYAIDHEFGYIVRKHEDDLYDIFIFPLWRREPA